MSTLPGSQWAMQPTRGRRTSALQREGSKDGGGSADNVRGSEGDVSTYPGREVGGAECHPVDAVQVALSNVRQSLARYSSVADRLYRLLAEGIDVSEFAFCLKCLISAILMGLL